MYGNMGPKNQTQQYVHQPAGNEVDSSPISNTQPSSEVCFDFEAASQTPDLPPLFSDFQRDETLLAQDDGTAPQCVLFTSYLSVVATLTISG